MTKNNFLIRLANDEDFEEIFTIWLDGILISFDQSSMSQSELKVKFEQNYSLRSGIFNYWIAVSKTNEMAGWQSLNKCTTNPLKDNFFAESSTYIKKDYRNEGVGELLLNHVFGEAKNSSLKYITAYISCENKGINLLCDKVGFTTVGQLPNLNPAERLSKLFIVKPL